MKISRNSFAKKHNISLSLVNVLCEKGIIPFHNNLIDDKSFDLLRLGIHYVECPYCNVKMACINNKHFEKFHNIKHKFISSKLYKENHKKTEKQKLAQSLKLKGRFKTPEGEITRKLIGEASRRLNLDPEFIKRKSEISLKIQNKPESKNLRGKKLKQRWADPVFRLRMKEYVRENSIQIKESAAHARKYLTKKSKLHSSYKETMLESGLKGFISEYNYGPYSIDEADPFAKIAIEVDGCYWHGCVFCGFKGTPRIQRIDKRKTSYLKNRGWLVFRIKEHEIKKDPYICIDMIKNIQKKRRKSYGQKIKESFAQGNLKVLAMVNKKEVPEWAPMSNILRHNTPHKRMLRITTDIGHVCVTEDHSLFNWQTKEAIAAKEIKTGDLIVGIPWNKFEPLKILQIEEAPPEEFTYDVSVPGAENAVLDSGILVHNSYSISGVSLDLEKSSKYQSMKDEFINEYDKVVEAAKRSIKIIKGLKQYRYGVGITSALGPLNRPGIQSRSNWISPFRPNWS